jgi:HSP20 family protein
VGQQQFEEHEMSIGDLVPWRWSGPRRFGDDRSLDAFLTEMESLHRNIDRLFADAWTGGFTPSLLSESWTKSRITPRLDVSEDDKAFHIDVELPGLSDKDISVTVADRVLTISGEKKEEKEKKEKDVFRSERAYGSFRRVLELPSAVDAGKIAAKFKDGVLRIEAPKSKEAQDRARQIPVKSA